MTKISQAKFTVGDVIHHRLFDYRGVVADVDPEFQLSEDWYEKVAKSRPPKNEPWYHVLVHGGAQTTYVAERNLEPDDSGAPVVHPMLDQIFSRFENGRFVRDNRGN